MPWNIYFINLQLIQISKGWNEILNRIGNPRLDRSDFWKYSLATISIPEIRIKKKEKETKNTTIYTCKKKKNVNSCPLGSNPRAFKLIARASKKKKKKAEAQEEEAGPFNFPLQGSRCISRPWQSGHFHRAKRRGKNMVPRVFYNAACRYVHLLLLLSLFPRGRRTKVEAKYRRRGRRRRRRRRRRVFHPRRLACNSPRPLYFFTGEGRRKEGEADVYERLVITNKFLPSPSPFVRISSFDHFWV